MTAETPPTPEATTDAAEAAFWREQEAGTTERDRGGYYGRGWRDGYARALTAETPPTPEATTVTEWGVRVAEGDPDYTPTGRPFQCRSQEDARQIAARDEWRTLCTRQRTSYDDTVTEWTEADRPHPPHQACDQ